MNVVLKFDPTPDGPHASALSSAWSKLYVKREGQPGGLPPLRYQPISVLCVHGRVASRLSLLYLGNNAVRMLHRPALRAPRTLAAPAAAQAPSCVQRPRAQAAQAFTACTIDVCVVFRSPPPRPAPAPAPDTAAARCRAPPAHA